MTSVPPAPLTFPPTKRIKKGRDFHRAKTTGRRLAQGVLVLNWLRESAPGESRLGVITSRRIGKAHTRNRARRLLRECFRLHQREIVEATDLVLVARPSIAGKDFATVDHDFLMALRRAQLLRSAA